MATLKAKPSPDRVPVGLELADDISLRRFLARTTKAKGGERKLIDHLCATVAQREKSLFALLDRSPEDLAQRLFD